MKIPNKKYIALMLLAIPVVIVLSFILMNIEKLVKCHGLRGHVACKCWNDNSAICDNI